MIRTILSRLCFAAIGVLPLTSCYGLKRGFLRLAGLRIGASVRIVSSARFVTRFVEIGENSFIGHECLIIAAHGSHIRIGKNVDLAPRVTIVTGGHEIGPPERRAGAGQVRDIDIGDGVWIGANSVILGGAKIGAGALIAAGSVVRRTVPPNKMGVGNPLRISEIPGEGGG